MKTLFIIFIFLFFVVTNSQAQFAPPAGQIGSTAIPKDSSILIAWATHCTVQRGPMDISQPGLGLANVGAPEHATGAAGDGFVLSLGDGGSATLQFEYPIRNGIGADFAIFENSFSPTFLELGFVEVSSDGQNFVRFPAISNTDTTTQVGPFGAIDATQIYNLAGKYKANFGTPFDLEELVADSAILDVHAVTHVRVIDVVGSIQDAYASYDSRGVKINDPWATPFGSSGLDLDAVGVIHQNTSIPIRYIPIDNIKVYPNPVLAGQSFVIDLEQEGELFIYNMRGQLVQQQVLNQAPISTQKLVAGTYIIQIQTEQQLYQSSLIIKN